MNKNPLNVLHFDIVQKTAYAIFNFSDLFRFHFSLSFAPFQIIILIIENKSGRRICFGIFLEYYGTVDELWQIGDGMKAHFTAAVFEQHFHTNARIRQATFK